jgi:hypothetical protein
MVEISTTNLILSGLFILATYVAIGWAVWMGYKGLTAQSPPFKEGGHRVGGKGTYDEHCRIGDKSCDEVRQAKAA